MKRIRQTVRGKTGNCFAACVAAILEMPLTSMPDHFKSERGDVDPLWLNVWQEFLLPLGLGIIWASAKHCRIPAGYAIASMKVRGRRSKHAVVCFDGEVKYDPLPGKGDFSGVAEWYVFTSLDASRARISGVAEGEGGK